MTVQGSLKLSTSTIRYKEGERKLEKTNIPCVVLLHLSTVVCDLGPELEGTKHYHLH